MSPLITHAQRNRTNLAVVSTNPARKFFDDDSYERPEKDHPSQVVDWPNNSVRERVDFAFQYYRHLRRLKLYVDANWQGNIRLTDAARNIGVSASRLSALFHEKTGLRFSDWLNMCRIEKAMAQLVETDRSVAEISSNVGFQCVRTFERSFRKFCGVSASEYRRKFVSKNLSQR